MYQNELKNIRFDTFFDRKEKLGNVSIKIGLTILKIT
ncbi:MAG: hypothetical protein PWP24_1647 [Clostridiales bacterium]|nr:hypothetical protein [Clostridiales bacterium]